MVMKLSLRSSFAAFVSFLAFARSHPSNNNIGVGIIDAHFDTNIFSTTSGKKFEFKSLFDFDSGLLGDGVDTIYINKSNDDDGNSNSTFHNDQGFASPSNLLHLQDHTADQLLSPNTLPCRFYTRNGETIEDLKQLKSMYVNRRRRLISSSLLSNSCISHQSSPADDTTCSDDNGAAVEPNVDEYEELHLYAVPNGRVFIYTPSFYAKCSKSYQKFYATFSVLGYD